jgi:hypothetical protein
MVALFSPEDMAPISDLPQGEHRISGGRGRSLGGEKRPPVSAFIPLRARLVGA